MIALSLMIVVIEKETSLIRWVLSRAKPSTDV